MGTQDARAHPANSPAQVTHMQPPSPGVMDRQLCLPPPTAESTRKGDGVKDSEKNSGNNLANSKHRSGADHTHLPTCIFSHAFPKSSAPPCCTRSFDLQTLSSSSSDAPGWIPLCPAVPSRSLHKEQEPQQFHPAELPTPCGRKGHLWVQSQAWGWLRLPGGFQKAAGQDVSLPLYAKSFFR